MQRVHSYLAIVVGFLLQLVDIMFLRILHMHVFQRPRPCTKTDLYASFGSLNSIHFNDIFWHCRLKISIEKQNF